MPLIAKEIVRIASLITHHYTLDEITTAFKTMEEWQAMEIIIHLND